MPEIDAMTALRASYRELVAKESRRVDVFAVRRYLRYAMDLLDIYLDIQRDRRWRKDEW